MNYFWNKLYIGFSLSGMKSSEYYFTVNFGFCQWQNPYSNNVCK